MWNWSGGQRERAPFQTERHMLSQGDTRENGGTQDSQVIFHSWRWNAGVNEGMERGGRRGDEEWQEAGEKGSQSTKPYLCFAKDLEIYHKGQCFSDWVICVTC